MLDIIMVDCFDHLRNCFWKSSYSYVPYELNLIQWSSIYFFRIIPKDSSLLIIKISSTVDADVLGVKVLVKLLTIPLLLDNL